LRKNTERRLPVVITNLEEFAFSQLYTPYCREIVGYPFNTNEFRQQKAKDVKELRNCPNRIIDILEKNPNAKNLVFNRLSEIGKRETLQWYWAIDYDRLDFCKYVEENLSSFGYTMKSPVHRGF
jgi:hypothetical protein